MDTLDQGLGGAELVQLGVGNAIQNLLDSLNRVTNTGILLLVGNVNQLGLTVLEGQRAYYAKSVAVEYSADGDYGKSS